jgi:hypothetical protein
MTWTCSSCNKTVEMKSTKRIAPPSGWKRDDAGVFCRDCWQKRAVLRAVVLPIVEIMDGTWEEFRAAVKAAFRLTTQAANWMMTELYSHDVRRAPSDEKMPKMQRQYLYPAARVRFPDLPSTTVASLEQAIQAKYRHIRYEVIWTCGKSLPTYRYPHPFPMPSQNVTVTMDDGGRPLVSFRLGDRRWTVRLKGGPRFRRQLAAVKLIADGGTKGHADLYEKGAYLMLKLVAWLPRTESPQDRVGTLVVRSTPESLLVAVNTKDERLWTYHADHIRRWSAEHRVQLQRWADDSKFEQRPVPSFSDRREAATKKYRNRMDSAVRQIAASLAGYAKRRKFASVSYDDSDMSFCPEFPWFQLRERIQVVLDEYGVEFERVPAAAA